MIGKGIELNKAGTDTPLMMETRSACCFALCCAVLCCAVLCCAVLHAAAALWSSLPHALAWGLLKTPHVHKVVLQRQIGHLQVCFAVSVWTSVLEQQELVLA